MDSRIAFYQVLIAQKQRQLAGELVGTEAAWASAAMTSIKHSHRTMLQRLQ